MELIETTVTATSVRMRYADAADHPKQWIDFQMPLEGLKDPRYMIDDPPPLEDQGEQPLSVIQVAALRSAHAAIGAEIRRIAGHDVRS